MLEKEKLTFHPITIADRDWINEKLKEENIGACEYTFSNNFVWAKVYDVQVGMVYGCGVIRYRNQENFEYSFPFGNGDKKAAIELLKGICAAHGHGLRLYPIVEKGRLDLKLIAIGTILTMCIQWKSCLHSEEKNCMANGTI